MQTTAKQVTTTKSAAAQNERGLKMVETIRLKNSVMDLSKVAEALYVINKAAKKTTISQSEKATLYKAKDMVLARLIRAKKVKIEGYHYFGGDHIDSIRLMVYVTFGGFGFHTAEYNFSVNAIDCMKCLGSIDTPMTSECTSLLSLEDAKKTLKEWYKK